MVSDEDFAALVERVNRLEAILHGGGEPGTHEPTCSLITSGGESPCDCWLLTALS